MSIEVANNKSYFSSACDKICAVRTYMHAQGNNVVTVLSKDLGDMEKMITHGKVIDAYFSMQSTFFSIESACAESFKASLKTLKGWVALGTLPKQVLETKEKIEKCFKNLTAYATLDCSAAIGTLVNKSYDAAGLLEKLNISYFAGVTQRFASTHFGCLGLAAFSRLTMAGERVASYYRNADFFELKRVDFNSCVSNGLKVVENISTGVFAGAMLFGGTNELRTATSAIGAFAKGAEYYWSKVLL